jgi:hypothetical protein
MTSIEQRIAATDLSEFAIFEGDCVNIAVALTRVFGGEIVASYAHEVDFLDGNPAHAAARIHGTLYDGSGTTSEDELRERAYYGVTDQDWDEIIVTGVQEPDSKLLNPETVETIETRLRSASTNA